MTASEVIKQPCSAPQHLQHILGFQTHLKQMHHYLGPRRRRTVMYRLSTSHIYQHHVSAWIRTLTRLFSGQIARFITLVENTQKNTQQRSRILRSSLFPIIVSQKSGTLLKEIAAMFTLFSESKVRINERYA